MKNIINDEKLSSIINKEEISKNFMDNLKEIRKNDVASFELLLNKILSISPKQFVNIVCVLYKENDINFNFFEFFNKINLIEGMLYHIIKEMNPCHLVDDISIFNKSRQSLFFNMIELTNKNIEFMFQKDNYNKSIFSLLILFKSINMKEQRRSFIEMFKNPITDSYVKEDEFFLLLTEPSLLESIVKTGIFKLTNERMNLLNIYLQKPIVKERKTLRSIFSSFSLQEKNEIIKNLKMDNIINKKRL